MNVVMRARAMATLGGATELARFREHDDLRAAASHLMECHLHHFAVLQDGHCTLVVSPMALECIKAIGLHPIEDREE